MSQPLPITVPYTVLVDSREQAPYTFEGLTGNASQGSRLLNITTRWAGLKTGDYSIDGFEDLVCIERKSKSDFYGTLGAGRDRFDREHQRMSRMEFAAVVIEASWASILSDAPKWSTLSPRTILGSALAYERDYGVHYFPAEDRRMAEIVTFRMLDLFFRKQAKRKKKELTNDRSS